MHSTLHSSIKQHSISVYAMGYFSAAVAISWSFSYYYLPFVIEDALIVYRYSDRLLHGHGLTWNNGEFVEGYSNLLWVLLVAGGGLVHANFIHVGWVLGLLANAALLAAVFWTFGRSSTESLLPLASGLATLSFAGSLALWGVAGLETPLLAALIGWALAMAHRLQTGRRNEAYLGLLLGLIAITRPDGILFGASIPVALMLRDGFSGAILKRTVRLLLFPFIFCLAQILFRLYYYGSFVPNTAYVKIAFTPERAWSGIIYLYQGVIVTALPMLALAALALFLHRPDQKQWLRRSLVFVIPGVVWAAYVAAIGGDIFPGHRHWIPTLVCLAFALSFLLTALPTMASRQMAALLVATASAYLGWQVLIGDIKHGYGLVGKATEPVIANETKREWDCIAIGEVLRRLFSAQQPLIAVNAAGCLPYVTRFPALDMLGLMDEHIARHRPSDIGKGPIGHELGDGTYVLSRRPDLIQLGGPMGSLKPWPIFRGDIELAGAEEFEQLYRPLFYRAGSVEMILWTRIEGGRLGITRAANRINIPGFLLASGSGVGVVQAESGEAVALLSSGEAILKDVTLPLGAWRISVTVAPYKNVQLSVSSDLGARTKGRNVVCIVSDGSPHSFHVSGQSTLIYSITAQRLTASDCSAGTPSRGADASDSNP